MCQSRELEGLVVELDQAISRRYAALDQSLRMVPGLGTATTPAMYAEIGDAQRFTDLDHLVAMAGVEPPLQESGQTAGLTKMSKRGSPYLRWAVWQAALTPCRSDPMFRAIYDRQRQRGKHHLAALCHAANKPMQVIYAALKSQRPYDPNYRRQSSNP